MLDWKNLSTRQRLTCLFFALFLGLCWAVVASAPSNESGSQLRDVLAGVAVTALMSALLLSPEAVRGKVRAFNPLSAPTLCKVLYAVALITLLARGLLAVLA